MLEHMMENLIKNLGFDPVIVRNQLETIANAAKETMESQKRVEAMVASIYKEKFPWPVPLERHSENGGNS